MKEAIKVKSLPCRQAGVSSGNPFKSLPRRQAGVIQTITKGHDGHLEVETEEEIGTRFVVQLPI